MASKIITDCPALDLAGAEELLSEIAYTAFMTEELLRYTDGEQPEALAATVWQLRRTINQLGWAADVGLHRLRSAQTTHGGSAEEWLLTPMCCKALGASND